MPQVKEMKKILIIVLFIITMFLLTGVVSAEEINLIDSNLILVEAPNLDFNSADMSCSALLGTNIIKVIGAALKLVRIGSSIATILIAMTIFFPAVIKGDAKELNASIKKCVWLAVVLMLIILLPILLRTVGNLFNWDLCGLF